MRFSLTFVAVAAVTTSVAYSQSVSDLVAKVPSCAVACLAYAATDANCDISDYSCQCGENSTAIATSAANCRSNSCVDHENDFASSLFDQICSVVENCSTSSSMFSYTGSTAPSATPSTWTSVSPSITSTVVVTSTVVPTTSGSSSASTSPQPTTGAGSKLQASAAAVGAIFIAAMVL